MLCRQHRFSLGSWTNTMNLGISICECNPTCVWDTFCGSLKHNFPPNKKNVQKRCLVSDRRFCQRQKSLIMLHQLVYNCALQSYWCVSHFVGALGSYKETIVKGLVADTSLSALCTLIFLPVVIVSKISKNNREQKLGIGWMCRFVGGWNRKDVELGHKSWY